jgi:ABC-2 type transport system ATP-binding protein
VLSEILGSHRVDDIVVEDPPLEEVISNVFSAAEKGRDAATQGAAT